LQEEHQQQKEILQSIQEEFETQISSPSSTTVANTSATTTTSSFMGSSTSYGEKPKHLGADKNNHNLVNQFDDSGKTRPS
jgi:hypothetical protein